MISLAVETSKLSDNNVTGSRRRDLNSTAHLLGGGSRHSGSWKIDCLRDGVNDRHSGGSSKSAELRQTSAKQGNHNEVFEYYDSMMISSAAAMVLVVLV